MSLNDLAPELISDILQWLDARSIARCRQVCARLSAIIGADLTTAYRMDLYMKNLVDNPDSRLSLEEKWIVWQTFERTHDDSIINQWTPISINALEIGDEGPLLERNQFALAIIHMHEPNLKRFTIFTPGYRTNGGNGGKTWDRVMRFSLPFPQVYETLDEQQGLSVVFDWDMSTVNLRYPEVIHFYGVPPEPHPEAKLPTVNVSDLFGINKDEQDFDLRGNFRSSCYGPYCIASLGWQIPHSTIEPRPYMTHVVYNWKEGVVIKRIQSSPTSDYCLPLNNRYFLLPDLIPLPNSSSEFGTKLKFDIIDIHAGDSIDIDLTQGVSAYGQHPVVQPVLTIMGPTFDTPEAVKLSSYAGYPDEIPFARKDLPFLPGPDGIVATSIKLNYYHPLYQKSWVLVTSFSSLIRVIEANSQPNKHSTIDWEQWPCYLLEHNESYSIVGVEGMKLGYDEDLLDFHPRPEKPFWVKPTIVSDISSTSTNESTCDAQTPQKGIYDPVSSGVSYGGFVRPRRCRELSMLADLRRTTSSMGM